MSWRQERSRQLSKLWRIAKDGTLVIVAGTVVASLSAYLFQVIGGRALGSVAFDPVTALLTVHFLVFSVLLMPIEQFTVRNLTLERDDGKAAVAGVVIAAVVGAAAFTFFTRDRFFDGAAMYALISIVAVLANSLLAYGRGYMAGQRRFKDYGMSSGGVGLVRVLMAVGFLAIASSGISLGWALALSPFAIVLWRPFSKRRSHAEPLGGPESANRFLAGFVLANAASQVLLLAAPLVARVIDDEPGLMSVIFVTFQFFRAPIVMAQNLLARLLPPFTSMAAAGWHDHLRKWSLRFGAAGFGLMVPAGVAGYLLGPPIVTLLFGSDFEPSAAMAGWAAAGMVLASVALFASQILVARGQTPVLALAWLAAIIVAGVTLVTTGLDADVRVAVAFFAGEVAALGFIVAAGAMRPRHMAPVAPTEAEVS